MGNGNNTLWKIVEAMAQIAKPCSAYTVAKKLSASVPSIMYHLKNLEEEGWVEKVKKGKYNLTKDIFPSSNGALVVIDEKKQYGHKVLFMGCIYYGPGDKDCPCSGVVTEECLVYKGLSPEDKGRIKPIQLKKS